MKYVVVLPYVYQPYFEACIATVKFPIENLLLIDNTQVNIGIMKSHNLGVAAMQTAGADYLIIMSAAIRFGEAGGLDFIDIIEKHPDYHVLNAAGKWQSPDGEKIMALGWHLTAIRKDVFESVGDWDENFTPYGFDDVDLTCRMKKFYGDKLKVETFPVDLTHASTSHSIQLANVHAPSTPRINYFIRKWGKHPGEWQKDIYDHPFNNPAYDLSYWPEPLSSEGISKEFAELGGDKNVGE